MTNRNEKELILLINKELLTKLIRTEETPLLANDSSKVYKMGGILLNKSSVVV